MPEPGHSVDNRRFDPQLAGHVPNLPPTDFTDPERSRQDGLAAFRARGLRVPEESELDFEDRLVPGLRADAPPVSIRVYRPHGMGRLPAVLWIHGGGFVRGAVEIDHPDAARAAAELSAVVVSVDYRLAPEHPYPAAIDDCQAALQWLVHEVVDVAADRVAVVGVSAGGALAAALAVRARDRGAPKLCFQALVIPMLDDRLDTPSMREFTDPRIFSRGVAESGWRHYLSSGTAWRTTARRGTCPLPGSYPPATGVPMHRRAGPAARRGHRLRGASHTGRGFGGVTPVPRHLPRLPVRGATCGGLPPHVRRAIRRPSQIALPVCPSHVRRSQC